MLNNSKDYGKVDRHKTPTPEMHKKTLRPEKGNGIFCPRYFRTTSVRVI